MIVEFDENKEPWCPKCFHRLEKFSGGWLNCRNPNCEQFAEGVYFKVNGKTQFAYVVFDSSLGISSRHIQFGNNVQFRTGEDKIDQIFCDLDEVEYSKKTFCPECKQETMTDHDGEMVCDNCNFGALELLQRDETDSEKFYT